jgi:hypothetical protein
LRENVADTAVAKRNVTAAIRRAAMQVKEARKKLYYRVRETPRGHALLQAAEFMRSPFDRRLRRSVAHDYVMRAQPPLMDPARGYGLTSVDKFENFDEVVATSRAIFEQKKVAIDEELAGFSTWHERKQQKYLKRKDKFLRNLLNDTDLRRNPALVDFALSDSVLGMAARYLDAVPYLCRVDIVYSLPRAAEDNIASQLFHVDPEGLTQVKYFIHLYDVGEPQGPFTFIPADDTTRILASIRALRRQQGKPHIGRYLDEEIDAVGGTDSIVRLKAPTGGGIAIDTSRCLHMGSRVQPGAFRLCLYLQYCTTPEQTNVFDVGRFKKDPVKYLAVKHSVAPNANRYAASQQQMA